MPSINDYTFDSFLICWLNIVFKKSMYGFYLATLLQNALKVITPFYIIYFVALGFSFWQIALISSLRSIIGLVFEIPTGMIADIYGKKTSVILGYSLSALTLFLIGLRLFSVLMLFLKLFLQGLIMLGFLIE